MTDQNALGDVNAPESKKGFWRFIIISTIGALIFLIPLPIGGQPTLLLSYIVDFTKTILSDVLVPTTLILLGISAFASSVGRFYPSVFSGFFSQLFAVSWFVTLVRIAAFLLACMVYLKVGPEAIWSKNTGGLILNELMVALVPFFFWAGLALPLLTDFGFMEFVGTLARKFMRPLFKVPGRAAVDCVASWIGSGTVGVVITDQQYRQGFYTGREAISIGTGFSVVAIPIAVLLVSFLDLTHLLPQIMFSMVAVGILLAIIMPRIPPICNKPDTYWAQAPNQGIPADSLEGVGTLTTAIRSASARALAKRDEPVLVSGSKVVADIWFALEPVVMVLGLIVTVLVEFTPLFQWLSFPFYHLLQFFGLPEAGAAAPTLLIGFADVFLPFIVGGSIEAEQTKFVIAVVALVQVVFLTEPGALLVKSPIPVNAFDLLAIFLIRTVIAVPVAVAISYAFI